jgi:hypothetical protein
LALKAVVLASLVASGAGVLARASATLTDTDREEIRQLVAHYARALSSCSADEYADLFTPDGVFTSDDFRGARHRELYGQRGTIKGRAGLKQLVLTEDFCVNGTSTRSTRSGGPSQPPSVEIKPSPEGAVGRAPIGAGGHYEDVYVKTSGGWRFKSRTVFMPPLTPAAPSR